MYEKPFKLEIVSPERVIFSNEAVSLSAPGVVGGFQILYNHAPFLSALTAGRLKVKVIDGKEILYATSGGFVEVKNNTVVVLVESAERAEEIDVKRAEAARERAEKRLREKNMDLDVERAHAALQRAMNRLRIAGRLG